MRYGIGTLRDNQRTRLCLIWINCVWKKSVDNKALVVWPSRDFRRDMTWHDVTWRDLTWRDMTWHDVAWRDMTWRDMTRHDVTWRDMTWDDVTWRDMTWHDVTWHDVTWRDMTIKLTIKRWSYVWPSNDFRATAYKFRTYLTSTSEYLLNWKSTWIFEVT